VLKINKVFTITLLVLSTFLVGCQSTTYKPEGVTSNNSALLKTDPVHAHGIFVVLDERLYINTINGKAAGDFFKGYPEETRLLEGESNVKVDYLNGQITSEGCVLFNAEVGSTYIIRKKRDGIRVHYWAELEGNNTKINQGFTA